MARNVTGSLRAPKARADRGFPRRDARLRQLKPERVENGGGGDVEDGSGVGIELEFHDAVDHEIVGHGLKGGCRDGIA